MPNLIFSQFLFQIGNWYAKFVVLESKPLVNDGNTCLEFTFTKYIPSSSELDMSEEKLIASTVLSLRSFVIINTVKLSRNDSQNATWSNEKSKKKKLTTFNISY